MSRSAIVVLGAIGGLALAVLLGAFALRNKRPQPSERPAPVAIERPAVAPDAAPAPPPPPASPDAAQRPALRPRPPVDKQNKAHAVEASLMAKLRDLEESDPILTLQLAREGNAQYPDSPDAPERQWMVAKALTNMGLFDEARVEAEFAVKQYPGTSWTNDLQRHVLSNPP